MVTLAHLSIRNLALVERVDVRLGPGLNVLTGETGAGKSVLLGALSLILGDRAPPEIIRGGADEARVQARFRVPAASELARRLAAEGLPLEAGEVTVQRVVRRSGRGRAWIGERSIGARRLAELMKGVVDITGQHEHVVLLESARQLDVLDAFAGAAAERARVAKLAAALDTLDKALATLGGDPDERARRQDYLEFALDEIRSLEPEPGEMEGLSVERDRLRAVDGLAAGLHAAELALYSGEGAVVEGLGRAARDLGRLAEIDPALLPYAEAASRLGSEVEDLARCVERQQRTVEANPARLEVLEARLDALHRLARKHGGELSGVVEEACRMEAELEALSQGDARRAELEGERDALQARFKTALDALSAKRLSGVERFETAVAGELHALGLPELRLRLALQPTDPPGPRGAERAEILVAPNLGEPLQPLRKTASGGELSRVLLGLKRVLAERTEAGIHVFDEIDTGIGGQIAHAVGQRLAGLGSRRQVLVVTHQAPVAAFADVHLLVEKQTKGGRTRTRVVDLDAEGQLAELGRMMGGGTSTSTRRFAEELRARAKSGEAATITPIAGRRRPGRRAALRVPGVAG